ncbi:Inositolphosphotransferase 1 [Spathaspora sp. JA1]|nr:Inositolphosphotransferase 1 [Spathaspora sp. JA1]
MQNISGVLTHLLFPNAPPWFINLYGEDKEANYEMPGYAAGLIRVDIALGTHLHSKGFHASPIVFGAIPSIHSSMAVMTFFFISYYARWTLVKIAAFLFVATQWWATIYLEHHWRIDLFIGLIYALFWFTIVRNISFGLSRVDENFIKSRLKFNFEKGSTMGMRVFRNTRLQRSFDPLE